MVVALLLLSRLSRENGWKALAHMEWLFMVGEWFYRFVYWPLTLKQLEKLLWANFCCLNHHHQLQWLRISIFLKGFSTFSDFTKARCLKISEKVSFNIASEASYIYILSGHKLIKNTKNGSFWRVFENLKLAFRQCYQTGLF